MRFVVLAFRAPFHLWAEHGPDYEPASSWPSLMGYHPGIPDPGSIRGLFSLRLLPGSNWNGNAVHPYGKILVMELFRTNNRQLDFN